MVEKMRDFLNSEKVYVRVGLEGENDPVRRREICWNARQRALGAVTFALRCGLDVGEAEAMFDQFCDWLKEVKK